LPKPFDVSPEGFTESFLTPPLCATATSSAPALRHRDVLGLDESRERARKAKSAAGQLLLGEEDAMEKSVGVEPEDHGGELPDVDRSFVHVGELGLQAVEHAPVLAFEDVRRVLPVRLEDRVG
jgi:hypothetical protein